MQSFVAAQANTMSVDMIAKADGEPIVSGTVTLYLQAKSGANAGKWFKTSDSTWSATEQAAGAATHQANGRWSGSIIAAAWIAGVRYDCYGKESGNLNIAYSDEVIMAGLTVGDVWDAATADHQTDGSTGQALTTAGAGGSSIGSV